MCIRDRVSTQSTGNGNPSMAAHPEDPNNLAGCGCEGPRLEDTFMDKLQRSWLVPIGVGTTGVVLGSGLASFKDGNARRSQFLMRGRVVAQGLSVAAIMWSLHYESQNPLPHNRKESQQIC
eukprot:TRINITY_DN609_c0_g2_i3.p1 TRINITY_DN609_c0_g2~~TRINITY_DN609_c0_g2_i3.p1  ORF type:complete len:121 (+),score=26.31 TRINITY_DN609_c0_g2_i3:163-525(+)